MSEPPKQPRSAQRPRYSLDVLVAITLFAIALATRWPHLMAIPAFADEGLEVLWGYRIALGGHLPLTAYDAYDGPLFPYLIAAAFKLFGVRMLVPRAVVAVCGALTVPATYGFGTVVAGRWTGVVAALLVSACPALVLYSSHYAWSNSLTPLFATLAFACVYAGVVKASRAALAAGGLLAALTLQTHPITILALGGAGIWLVRSQAEHPWLTAAELRRPAAFFVVGYLPMVVGNFVRPLISLRVASGRTYAFAPSWHPAVYAARAVDLGRTFLDSLAGGLSSEHFPAPLPAAVAAAGLLCIALRVDLTRRRGFFSWMLLPSALAIPVCVKLFLPRYLTFLLPAAFVAIAAAVVPWLTSAARPRIVGWLNRTGSSGFAIALMVGLATRIYPLGLMDRYTTWALERGLSNDGYFGLRDAVLARHACGPQLYVEDVGRPLTNPAWVGLYAVDYVLTLSGCDHRLLTVGATFRALSGDPGSPGKPGGNDAWAILSNPPAVDWSQQHWRLEPAFVFGATAGQELLPITLYRISRGGGQ